jgi:PAS domain S-box-containing protein
MDEHGSDNREEQLQLLSRDELEERVRQRTSELGNVMGAMADVLIKLDQEGNISMINEAVTEILGHEKDEVEGKPVDILLTEPPEDSQSPVSSSSHLMERLLREGQVTDVEVYFSTADYGAVPMSLSASTLEDENGVPTGIVCVAKDISERKEAEERAEFLHSLLRHDLGNSLQISRGFLEILVDADLPDQHQQYAEKSMNAVEDGVELIENVRTLSRIDGSESHDSVDLKEAVTGALDRHEELRKEQGIELETDIERATVRAGTLLMEVFANLVENALVHSNADLLRLTTTVDEETVTVTLEDDGDGISPDERSDIFKKGYSSGDSSGSGLGMYIVNELVDNYDGGVSVGDSELGGTRFDVRLLRAE